MRNRLSAKIAVIFLLGAITLPLTLTPYGCTGRESRVIMDRAGRRVEIKHPINRIISTAPSNTEIIASLGMAGKLVAIDRHSANVMPPAGRPGIPDNLVKLDFFYPDAEAIINLKPDIIIASGHNATGSGDDPFRLLGEMGIPVVYISMSRSIDDIYRDIAFIADLLQIRHKGEEVINAMKADITEITQRTVQIKNKKTVYFEISSAPDMFTFGKDSFLNDMISAIGAVNIFANDNWIISPSAEAIIERNPDVILTNVDYIEDPIGEIKGRPGFGHINAVIYNRVYQIDNDSSVRPSPGIILALRQMSYAVYPDGVLELYDGQ
jgi:iron complex transport system substrate-binding protein